MSRIGKIPVPFPAGVEVTIDGQDIAVKAPRAPCRRPSSNRSTVVQGARTAFSRSSRPDDHRRKQALGTGSRAPWSTTSSPVSPRVTREGPGDLGVGYRVSQGQDLEFALGYSHPVPVEAPEGITFEVQTPTRFSVRVSTSRRWADLGKIRRCAAGPYKGKGVRYEGEDIRRKVGKSGK